MKYTPFTLATLMLASACGSSTPSDDGFEVAASALEEGLFAERASSPVDANEARELAEDLVGGEATEVELEMERGLEVYEVEVLRPSGSEVEIEIAAVNGRVLEIESDSPVAGDDLDVGEGFLTLQEAIAAAAAFADGALSSWEIELEEDGRWVWEIEFVTSDGDDREVELDARTGALRDDDDGDEPWDDDEGGDDDDDDDCDDDDDDDERCD